ncbi:radical SAM protein [Candidatus Margulisiibacteriota bacterium]
MNLGSCNICPHQCGVNRFKGQKGFCKAGADILVSHIGLHFGEEPPISGTKGSGTIFFGHCNLRCVFCQNYQISQPAHDFQLDQIKPDRLATEMLILKHQGAHNINLVSPTHFLPQIIESLKIARNNGLTIPIVYNTNAYEETASLKYLKGLIDIYMPDIKYSDDKNAEKYSGIKNYTKKSQAAISEMFTQVGDLTPDRNGVARKGLLVRHLVLPNDLAGSKKCLRFLAGLSKDMYISIMSQYSPQFKAYNFPQLNREITNKEYETVTDYALKLGLENCFIQEPSSSNQYLPDFEKKNPF